MCQFAECEKAFLDSHMEDTLHSMVRAHSFFKVFFSVACLPQESGKFGITYFYKFNLSLDMRGEACSGLPTKLLSALC